MSSPQSNRLAAEKSPYLLQHAHNPVDWYPWGEEAFAKARTEDKPIFLSIGYSTCHWCHVMEHESFESAAIAAFLNENFVSIKVDREERPDIDQVYMTFVQATTGHGGWPLSAWLTPDLRPFVGGTYFPPTDHPGRPGFITALRRISELWKSDRAQVDDRARSLLSALQEAEAETEGGAGDFGITWNPAPVLRFALNQYARMFDAQEGGFGSAPKFPRPVNLQFLLQLSTQKGSPSQDASVSRAMSLHTLRKMAAGGMHDHLGGGFHRYSVDAEWHVPHFEKMLYDQAQLAQVYLTAHQLTAEEHAGHSEFAPVARNILQYVAHDLTSPDGAFYSAEDADSLPTAAAVKKTEGAFYIWTHAAISEVLGEDRLAEFATVYGVEPDGNVPIGSDPHGELDGVNVLIQRFTVPEAAKQFQRPLENMDHRLHDDRAVLLARRGLRPRPHLDDKILTAWNGLMIGAYARSARVLGDDGHLRIAQRAATFLREHLYNAETGELRRSYRQSASAVPGFAADYASLISGLLDLYEADFDLAWLKWARRLQDTLDLNFWDEARDGYFSAAKGDASLILRLKEDYDGAEPAPTSLAAHNLWRLAQFQHNDVLLDHARKCVRAFIPRLEAQPIAMPLLLAAGARLETPPIHLILHSPAPDHPMLRDMLLEARRFYLPHLTLLRIATPADRDYFAPLHPAIAALPETPTEPAAYLCRNFTCDLPLTTPGDLRTSLAKL